MLPVQTKRMRFGVGTVTRRKGGKLQGVKTIGNLLHPARGNFLRAALARERGGGIDRAMTRTFLLRFLPCLALVLLAGCSTYNQRFAQASRADVHRLVHEGAYAGRWWSAQNSVWGGKLRCILTKVEMPVGARGGQPAYRAEFHATWHGLSSTHSVVLQMKPSARKKGALDFEGTSALHTIIGAGTYSCKGTLAGGVMRACYDSTYDKGTFEMAGVTLHPVR